MPWAPVRRSSRRWRTAIDPAAAKALPRIGDFQRFDVERILMLKPDLVLAWNHGNPGRELAQLEAAGLRLYYLEPRRLDDVPRALKRIGACWATSARASNVPGRCAPRSTLRRAMPPPEPVR